MEPCGRRAPRPLAGRVALQIYVQQGSVETTSLDRGNGRIEGGHRSENVAAEFPQGRDGSERRLRTGRRKAQMNVLGRSFSILRR